MANDKVVIIVLNNNKKDDLIECLESVYKLNYSPFEIVVIDNNSIDGSQKIVEQQFSEAHLIKLKENLGVAKGRNAGINFAKKNLVYNHLLFLDNDTKVEENFLSKLVKGFSYKENIGITCGKCYTEFPSNTISTTGMITNLYTGLIKERGAGEIDSGQYNNISEINACAGYAFLISKSALESIEKLDERYSPYGWEDVDCCLKIRKKGYKILYIPKAIICHKGTKQGRKPIPEYERNKVRNYFLLLKNHTNFLQKVTCLFFVPPKILLLFFKLIIRGDGSVIFHQFEGVVDIFSKRKNLSERKV